MTSALAFLSIGFPEMLVIGFVALLVFGGRLPEVMRDLGRSYARLRESMSQLSRPIREEMNRLDRPPPSPRPRPKPRTGADAHPYMDSGKTEAADADVAAIPAGDEALEVEGGGPTRPPRDEPPAPTTTPLDEPPPV